MAENLKNELHICDLKLLKRKMVIMAALLQARFSEKWLFKVDSVGMRPISTYNRSITLCMKTTL